MKRGINPESENTDHDTEAHSKQPEAENLATRKHVRRMDVLAYSLGAIATIIAIVAGVESYHHKSFTIWLTCVSGILYVVGCCCYWQDVEWKREAEEKQAERLASLPAPAPATSVHPAIVPALEKQGAKQDKAQETLDRILAKMEAYQKRNAPDLSKEFPLGYSLFTMKGREEIIPFRVPAGSNVVFKWNNASVKVSNDFIVMTLPDVTMPGVQMTCPSVGLANKAGASTDAVFGNINLVCKIIDTESDERLAVIGLKPFTQHP